MRLFSPAIQVQDAELLNLTHAYHNHVQYMYILFQYHLI
jgi:hypothetical protein